jgi:predicted transcriptional regulator
MSSCFVIQPFDGSKFDARFEDIFRPAIEKVGLTPYRVDRDPSVSIPIDQIESGIRNSLVCFAEITTDNPNVWFELGYAIACGKEVVMVCSEERESKFPFDVHHRNIIRYKTSSPREYEALEKSMIERLKALIEKQGKMEEISKSPLKETEGLQPHEIVALASVMQNLLSPEDRVSAHVVRSDMLKAGYTDLAVSLALRSLVNKDLLEYKGISDPDGEHYFVYKVTRMGTDWLIQNQDKLILKSKVSTFGKMVKPFSSPPAPEDDLPF